MRYSLVIFCVLVMSDAAGAAGVAVAHTHPEWTLPFPAFKIAGNLYYVGSKDLASYLIATPQGHVLINSSLDANVALIRSSVEQLKLKFNDIKILLISQAHAKLRAAAALPLVDPAGYKSFVADKYAAFQTELAK